MNWQDWENEHKKMVDGHETPVDTDALWAKLEQRKRRRRPFWMLWWPMGCLALLLSVAALGWWWAVSSSQAPTRWIKNTAQTDTHVSPTQKGTETSTSSAATSALSTATHPSLTKGGAATDETSIAASVGATPVSGISKSNSLNIQPKTTAPATNNSPVDVTSSAHTDKAFIDNATAQNVQPKGGVDNTPTTPIVIATNTENNSDKIEQSIEKSAESANATSQLTPAQILASPAAVSIYANTNNTASIPTSPASVSDFTIASALPPKPNLESAATLPPSAIAEPLPVVVDSLKQQPQPPANDVSELKKAEFPVFSVALLSGLQARFVQRDNTYPHDGERNLESVSVGLNLGYALNERWHLSTGVHYQWHNSVYRWNNTVKYTRPQQIVNFPVDGDSFITEDSNVIEIVLLTQNVRHYNSVKHWTIPLEVGVSMPLSRRWSYQSSLGVALLLRQTAQGKMSSLEGRPDSTLFPLIYQRNFGVQLRTSVAFNWQLNRQWRLTVQPLLTFDASSRLTNANERWLSGGLQFGLVRYW
jgi:hypothetical protein